MSWLSYLLGRKRELSVVDAPLLFTNTLTGRKERFVAQKPPFVALYSCGPTVYSKQHIGNLKASVFADLVARVLTESGYHLRRVMNITDVGHLVGDGDHGEDKMAKGAREEQKSPTEIAEQYTKLFLDDLRSLGIDTEDILFPRATEYVKEQIAMIRVLEQKGFAYRAEDGIYFDTGKFPGYGKLGNMSGTDILPGARIEKIRGKRGSRDFVLWRDMKPGDLQVWPSPWGAGNPGWHIECSAMNLALLGPTIDIHTGGIDHIPTHHNNEIAQSESANGKPLARYWMHEAFVTMEDDKIAKSVGNVVYLSDIEARGFHPLSLRYFYLQAHYRKTISFTWEALAAANEALTRLWRLVREVKTESSGVAADSDKRHALVHAVRDDLGTPEALAILWESLKDEELSPEEKWGVVVAADSLLGLSLLTPPSSSSPLTTAELPEEVQKLVYKRDLARRAKDFRRADELRHRLIESGYRVEDSGEGTLLTKES